MSERNEDRLELAKENIDDAILELSKPYGNIYDRARNAVYLLESAREIMDEAI